MATYYAAVYLMVNSGAAGYRPTKVRASHGGGDGLEFYLFDVDKGLLCGASPYTSGDAVDISNPGDKDIGFIYVGRSAIGGAAFAVTNIEFYNDGGWEQQFG